MATKSVLPITIVARAFDPNFNGTLAEQLDAMAAALRLETQEVFALFVVGDIEPSSDVGPWAQSGRIWKYFDAEEGAYVAFQIPQERLKYIVQIDSGNDADDPDPAVYEFWLVIDEDGQPADVRTWNEGLGDWVGLMERLYTRDEIDAFFEPAVDGKKQILAENVVGLPSAFSNVQSTKLGMVATQSIVGNDPAVTLQFNSKNWGDDANVDLTTYQFKATAAGKFRFTVNLQLGSSSGTPSAIAFTTSLIKNGAVNVHEHFPPHTDELGTQSINFSAVIDLAINDAISLVFQAAQTGAGNWNLGAVNTWFAVERVA